MPTGNTFLTELLVKIKLSRFFPICLYYLFLSSIEIKAEIFRNVNHRNVQVMFVGVNSSVRGDGPFPIHLLNGVQRFGLVVVTQNHLFLKQNNFTVSWIGTLTSASFKRTNTGILTGVCHKYSKWCSFRWTLNIYCIIKNPYSWESRGWAVRPTLISTDYYNFPFFC